ncbi:hypothetical protein MRB53_039920 [Persea americana]|nr:hypothetical protein MRB53_039920 [Persea americana]
MHILPFLSTTAKVAKILISNDDGWAEMNVRQLYFALEDAGYESIISAPADNKSGTGSLDSPPTQLGADGLTSVKYGIDFAEDYFGQSADLVVAGVNVGRNLGVAVYGSGTVGAAVEGAKNSLPAIAFSGCTGSQISWEEPVPEYAALYANLSALVVKELLKGSSSSDSILPPGTWLNVNFGSTSVEACSDVSSFNFVLSRILPAIPVVGDKDIDICNNDGRLPLEWSVIHSPGCYASISVGTTEKATANAAEQQIVNLKLKNILTCLPQTIREEATDQIPMEYAS